MSVKKSAIISIVGKPNVGKSTLLNRLVGTKIAIVSNKPQTTRTRITGVVTKGDCQFVFQDTPGLHKPRSRLGDYMVKVVNDTVTDVDIAAMVVDPVPHIGPAEQELMERMKQYRMPSVLVINKIDTVKNEDLLAVIAAYSEAHTWDAVVPLSAKTGENCDILFEEFEKFAIEGPQLFPDDMLCDQPERQLVAEIIREKMLRNLEREVPHGTAVAVEQMREREDGLMNIAATIYCEKNSHKGIIIGKQGAMLRKIGSEARVDIEKLMGTKIMLRLWVKVREDWRNRMDDLRTLGYESN
mgnify:FL=1